MGARRIISFLSRRRRSADGARSVALALAAFLAALFAAPTGAQAEACSPEGLPAGAVVVDSGPDALVWQSGDAGTRRFFACLRPSGASIPLSIAETQQASFTVAGEWVGYYLSESGSPVATFNTLDVGTDAGSGYLLRSDATLDPSGDVLGTLGGFPIPGSIGRHDLVLYTPGSSLPAVLDPMGRGTAIFAGGGVQLTRGGRRFTVAPAAMTPSPGRVSACHALSRGLVRGAGGEGAGRDRVLLIGTERGVCTWNKLQLIEHPENGSERTALLASSHADGLRFLRTPGAVSFLVRGTGFEPSLRLFVAARGTLVELAVLTHRPRHVLGGLQRAAAAVVRSLRAHHPRHQSRGR
jgi:hypothetical protein